MRADTRLPLALVDLGLLPRLPPAENVFLSSGVRVFAAPGPPEPPPLRAAMDGEPWPADRQ
jgi:hypothetical protein